MNITTKNETMKPTKQQLTIAAFPTHPLQDNFGNVSVSFGMSKLEYMATKLAAGMLANPNKTGTFPELSKGSIDLAIKIIEECERVVGELPASNPTGRSITLP
jgi:hypothetical protein